MKIDLNGIRKKLIESVRKYRFVLLILALGLVLLSIPPSSKHETSVECLESKDEICDIEVVEARLKKILSHVDGAGKVEVMLTVKNDGERTIASDTESSESNTTQGDSVQESFTERESAVIVSTGSGTDDAVTLKYTYPEFQGAIIVAEGADSPTVKLNLTDAVCAVTGLPTKYVKVIKMK